jgi:hypothetical protein
MRSLGMAALPLLLAACTTTAPTGVPAPAQPLRPQSQAQPQQPQQRGGLLGLSTDELVARFGRPGFQVREGPGLKLQWSVPGCVLDTYLYPPPSGIGIARVTYAETRRPDGNPTDQAGCIAAIDAAG